MPREEIENPMVRPIKDKEPKVFGYDYQGLPIYEGEEYIEFNGEYLLVNEMNSYTVNYLNKIEGCSVKVAE